MAYNSNLIGGADYNSGPYSVTFPAGMTSVSFVIIINNDNILEDDEDFNLAILPTTYNLSGATVIIINDDGKYNILNMCYRCRNLYLIIA